MFRFSHLAVATGQVPSTGNALTGSRSPLPASITAVIFCTKSGARSRRAAAGDGRIRGRRHRNLVEMGERLIHHGAVPPHDLGSPLAVRLLDALLDLRDGFIHRQQAGDREEAGLHDRVDPRAHAAALRQVERVDREETDLPVEDLLLHLPRQAVPHLVRCERRVEQECRARRRMLEHVDLVHELELVTGDEAGAIDEVCGSDRRGLVRR
jgi:hypothetical protein